MRILSPFLLVLCFSCSKYTQIFQTQPITPGITTGERLVYENDTIKITYSFWQKGGIMVFDVYNKIDVPLYIDWKKSSFVKNGRKLNYWSDETVTHRKSSRVGSVYSSNDYYSFLGISESIIITRSRSVKPERITFLAPRSDLIKFSYFELYPFIGQKLKEDAPTEFLKTGSASRPVSTKYKTFSLTTSPLQFRNFLTISTTEQFNTEVYIDNGFYVSRITQMKHSQFMGKEIINHGGTTYEMPFKAPSLFYTDAK